MHARGWAKDKSQGGLLPVFKLGGLDWIYSRLYRHDDCPRPRDSASKSTRFNTLHPMFMQQLPEVVLANFPGVRTRYQVSDLSSQL